MIGDEGLLAVRFLRRSLPAVADSVRECDGWLDAPGILDKEIVGAQGGFGLKLRAQRLGLELAVADGQDANLV